MSSAQDGAVLLTRRFHPPHPRPQVPALVQCKQYLPCSTVTGQRSRSDRHERELLEVLHRPSAPSAQGGPVLLTRRFHPPHPRPQVPGPCQLHGHQLVPRVAAGGSNLCLQEVPAEPGSLACKSQ